jgi:hypothetical protein
VEFALRNDRGAFGLRGERFNQSLVLRKSAALPSFLRLIQHEPPGRLVEQVRTLLMSQPVERRSRRRLRPSLDRRTDGGFLGQASSTLKT